MTTHETLIYAFAPTSLGLLLVAESSKGISCVQLGEQRGPLLAEFKQRFVGGKFSENTAALAGTAARLVDVIESGASCKDLCIDLRGTPFQLAVWAALRKIPRGTTTTYSAVAERIGARRAVRAVASACGANRLAILVPCHRVLTIQGKISGYRWGVERKRALLEREGAWNAATPMGTLHTPTTGCQSGFI